MEAMLPLLWLLIKQKIERIICCIQWIVVNLTMLISNVFKMKYFVAFLFAICALTASAKGRTKVTTAQLDSAACSVMQMLETRQWSFIPSQVQLGRAVKVDNLCDPQNAFSLAGEELKIFLDLSSGNVSNSLPGLGKSSVCLEKPHPSIPPFYRATGKVRDVIVKRQAKNIHVKVLYTVTETNTKDAFRPVRFEMDINPMTMETTAAFDGRGGESAIYNGTLYHEGT